MTDQPSGIPLTDDEHTLLRRAAFGAIALVSQADPGFLAAFKESMAGSQALQAAPEDVRSLLSEGGRFPTPPTGTPEQVEAAVLRDLARAVQVLAAKAPRQVAGFRQVVLAAADLVAGADRGVTPAEQGTVDRVREALSGGLAGEPPVGDTAGDAPRHD
ncbi:hypothetical protein [Ornithinimicrobium pekingense]|uniref:TerB family tellurite resistance protein n=1 Tax=Ornithinimicrobium pekingense TaxID=384677 RepID=A0ABQ2F6P9_9MICO|nr:hypothetical protein [Ornithinimicrobium pekingense]GGK64487.1 hypothetical protein GCM10011509_10960 [Ornithinimicrobium pekingense]